MRFLKASWIWIGCRTWSSISCASGVLWTMIIWRTICCGCGCRWEKARLGSCLVGRLVHLSGLVCWFSNWICQLNYKIVIEVVFVRALWLLRDARSDYFTFDALTGTRGRRLWYRWRWTRSESPLIPIIDCVCVISSMFWHLWATFSLLLSNIVSCLVFKCLSASWFVLLCRINLHGLI